MTDKSNEPSQEKTHYLSESKGYVTMNVEQYQFVQTNDGQDQPQQDDVPPRFF
ncbi:hypothetical protein GCM10009696_36400 [Kocuria himachalensis]